MTVDIFTLCDYARAESDGRLTIASTWATIFADEVPHIHRSITFALRMRFEANEDGSHHLKVVIVDADGQSLVEPIQYTIETKVGEKERYHFVPWATFFRNVTFEKYGEYRIDFLIDGSLAAESPIFVRPVPAPKKPNPNPNAEQA